MNKQQLVFRLLTMYSHNSSRSYMCVYSLTDTYVHNNCLYYHANVYTIQFLKSLAHTREVSEGTQKKACSTIGTLFQFVGILLSSKVNKNQPNYLTNRSY